MPPHLGVDLNLRLPAGTTRLAYRNGISESGGAVQHARRLADHPHPQSQLEHQDRAMVRRARGGDAVAMDQVIERYRGFVRLKASAYFLAGGELDDLVQEGLIGLFKAVRDYRPEREASFRS